MRGYSVRPICDLSIPLFALSSTEQLRNATHPIPNTSLARLAQIRNLV